MTVQRAGVIHLDTKPRSVGPLVGLTQDMREVAEEIRNIGLDLTALEEAAPGEGGGGGGGTVVGAYHAGVLETTFTAFSDEKDLTNGVVPFIALSAPILMAARVLRVRMTTSAVTVSGGTLTLVGVSNQGEAINQVVNLADIAAANAGSGYDTECFAALTSATIAGATTLTGTPGDNAITLMYGPGMGLPCPPGVDDFEVFASSMDQENVGTVDPATGVISPTTEFDGVSDFTFYFRYTAPPVVS